LVFIILNHYAERFDTFRRDMGEWVATGRLRMREDVVDALETAPAAFIDLPRVEIFGSSWCMSPTHDTPPSSSFCMHGVRSAWHPAPCCSALC
jgi:hypothetical protein